MPIYIMKKGNFPLKGVIPVIVSNGINNNTAGVAGVDRPGQRRGRRDAFVRRNQKEKDSSKNEKLLPTDILDINSSRDRSTPDSDD